MSSRSLKRRHGIDKCVKARITVCVVGILTVLFFASIFAFIAAASSWISDLPSMNSLDSVLSSNPTRVFAADKQTLLAEFQLDDRIPVSSCSQISDYAMDATVAIEDERFYVHHGVDILGIFRAIFVNIFGSNREGASTLTQQLVRNTVLSNEMNVISIKRKIREAYLAFKVEEQYDKDKILLLYMNTVNYGSGAYGIETAAQRYFSKPAKDLTLVESATLVGIPQSPNANNPISNPDKCLNRRNTVLMKMRQLGYISKEDFDIACEKPLELNLNSNVTNNGIVLYPYFTSYLRDQLISQYGKDKIFSGGLTVYSTLDVAVQKAAEDAAAKENSGDLECALSAVDPNTGFVRAIVGGRDYNENQYNLATQGQRQPGSSFKTFTMLAAIEGDSKIAEDGSIIGEGGISPTQIVDCTSTASVDIGFDKRWVVSNAFYANYGYSTMERAYMVSSNTGFARIVAKIGPSKVAEMAKRLGIESDLDVVPSLTLGTSGVTTLEMASAFAVIANGGEKFKFKLTNEANPEDIKYKSYTTIEKVIDQSGNLFIDNTCPEKERVLSKDVAATALQVMKKVVSNGTGKAAQLSCGQEVAGKTGTSENEMDSYFCGMTPDISVAIWHGDRNYKKSSSSSDSCTRAFANMMNKYYQNLYEVQLKKDNEHYKNLTNSQNSNLNSRNNLDTSQRINGLNPTLSNAVWFLTANDANLSDSTDYKSGWDAIIKFFPAPNNKKIVFSFNSSDPNLELGDKVVNIYGTSSNYSYNGYVNIGNFSRNN